jgi:hypothetical protein
MTTDSQKIVANLNALRLFNADDWYFDPADSLYKSKSKATFITLTREKAQQQIDRKWREKIK